MMRWNNFFFSSENLRERKREMKKEKKIAFECFVVVDVVVEVERIIYTYCSLV